ncbi:unnamed protein product, partial [Didymodactylos carnosus]
MSTFGISMVDYLSSTKFRLESDFRVGGPPSLAEFLPEGEEPNWRSIEDAIR